MQMQQAPLPPEEATSAAATEDAAMQEEAAEVSMDTQEDASAIGISQVQNQTVLESMQRSASASAGAEPRLAFIVEPQASTAGTAAKATAEDEEDTQTDNDKLMGRALSKRQLEDKGRLLVCPPFNSIFDSTRTRARKDQLAKQRCHMQETQSASTQESSQCSRERAS